MLAEMVLHGPRTSRSTSDSKGQPVSDALPQSPNSVHDEHHKRKVKKEKERESEEEVEDEVSVPPAPVHSLSKPVALSLVDFSFVLSLVFGGCCSYVPVAAWHRCINNQITCAIEMSTPTSIY